MVWQCFRFVQCITLQRRRKFVQRRPGNSRSSVLHTDVSTYVSIYEVQLLVSLLYQLELTSCRKARFSKLAGPSLLRVFPCLLLALMILSKSKRLHHQIIIIDQLSAQRENRMTIVCQRNKAHAPKDRVKSTYRV